MQKDPRAEKIVQSFFGRLFILILGTFFVISGLITIGFLIDKYPGIDRNYSYVACGDGSRFSLDAYNLLLDEPQCPDADIRWKRDPDDISQWFLGTLLILVVIPVTTVGIFQAALYLIYGSNRQ